MSSRLVLLLISVGVMFLLFIVFIVLFIQKKQFKEPKKPFNALVAQKLYEALGESNVLKVTIEHQRLKFYVSSLKRVSREKLKETQYPAIVKGKEVTLFIRYYPDDMFTYINEKVKGA